MAMECLREMMINEKAPEDLKQMSDQDLLQSIGALKEGKLTIAGLLMVGKNEPVQYFL